MSEDVCLECECPIVASVDQRIGEGLRSCSCTKADLREALDRAYRCISEQGEKLDALAGKETKRRASCPRCAPDECPTGPGDEHCHCHPEGPCCDCGKVAASRATVEPEEDTSDDGQKPDSSRESH